MPMAGGVKIGLGYVCTTAIPFRYCLGMRPLRCTAKMDDG